MRRHARPLQPGARVRMPARLALQHALQPTTAGRAPDASAREPVERIAGVDLSAVRVHRDSPLPRAFAADALAFGEHVHLDASVRGSREPEILRHELAHVVQQRAGLVRPETSQLGVAISTSSRLEAHADAVASAHAHPALMPSLAAHAPARAPVVQRHGVGSVVRIASARVPGYFGKVKRRLNRHQTDLDRLQRQIASQQKKMEGVDPESAKGQHLGDMQAKIDAWQAEHDGLQRAGRQYEIEAMDGSGTTHIVSHDELGSEVMTPSNEPRFQRSLLQHNNFIQMPRALRSTAAPAGTHMSVGTSWLAFRGDTREKEELFDKGLHPREPKHDAPIYRYAEQDIHSASAVNVSRSPAASAMFPLPSEADLSRNHDGRYSDHTYVYALAPDHHYDTHALQQKIGSDADGYAVGNQVVAPGVTAKQMANANLYGQELATEGIAGHRVVGRWRVKRTWKGTSYRDGADFETLDFESNPDFLDPGHGGRLTAAQRRALSQRVKRKTKKSPSWQ